MTHTINNNHYSLPKATGLYDPRNEKDSCGVGFVAHIKGKASHQTVLDADHILRRMVHRGGCGCEENTGDGAGILTGLPQEFMRRVAQQDLGIELPQDGFYCAGNVFLPQDQTQAEKCMTVLETIIAEEGQQFLGWRTLPVDPEGADIGPTARLAQPAITQLFITAAKGIDSAQFERKLFVIRKRATHQLRSDESISQRTLFYICSLSSSIIIYKGMLTPDQVMQFYPDLKAEDYASHLAMVHSRFSTNTFPSWDRAQPNRFMSHNGEINTLRGNANWMSAREGSLQSDLFDDISKLTPIVEPDCSDSGTFDNVLEFLLMSGRSLQEAMMMMVPEAWQSNTEMSADKKAFYKYNSSLMEPWDGPASIAFTDGKYIGAVLDRNGLRPSRYYVTHDDMVIMASEIGVLEIDPANIKLKGRLQPGKMFLIDFAQGKMIPDEELKTQFSQRYPYEKWLNEQSIELASLNPAQEAHGFSPETLIQRMQAFGYTTETMQFMLIPLVKELRDPVGSMGNDAALACLSDKSRMIYDYFKQLFAQVTNPAIDSIREEIVMSLECYIGPEQNLLDISEQHCHRLHIPHPILRNEELAALSHIDHRGWRAQTIDITYQKSDHADALTTAIDHICTQAAQAIDDGFSLIILSDRHIDASNIAISALLATAAVHHHLIKLHKRTQIGIIVESGEAREVHHHCLLIGFGADAINPYLAFEALWQSQRDGLLSGEAYDNDDKIVAAYRKGVAKGMLKVMAKMGISTLQSYKGAQIFEAIGLASQVIDKCFVDTASRIQGVGFDVLATEAWRRHELGFPVAGSTDSNLSNPGDYHWRANGDDHMWNPKAIASLQNATRTNNQQAYDDFAQHANDDSTRRCTLRGLLSFKINSSKSIKIDEVEPASEIVKRFCTGAMSFGSISQESHESLAIAMNRLGGKSNTGEGGEDPTRFITMENGDSKRSAIKQVASGRFGVTMSYLSNADEIQIKISQGAKPGEGGELPGSKVDENIAKIRHSTPGVGLISPPPHHDIYSIEDIAQLIHDLKNANPQARISVKLVSEMGVGTIATGVTKAKTDHLVIAGHDGGTGASPLTSIKHAGLPWELGIAETHQTLVMNDLRSRVVLQTDGQIKTGRDVVIATLLGAEEFGFSTAPLITLGCIMMRKCHLNTCPVGIATQDKELRKKFNGKPEHVVNYMFMVAEEARSIMAELGFNSMTDMIGRVDLLETNQAISHWKTDGLDLTPLLTMAQKPSPDTEVYQTRFQDHELDKALDIQLIKLAKPALESGKKVNIELPIININRVVGTMLSNAVVKKYGAAMLPDDTINIKLTGWAGQSLGAFLVKGITIELEGDSNDYVGKGMCGGKLIVYPPKSSTFKAEDNILLGNVGLYGATSGEAYFRGIAAERFCVRNSGASAVVEGIGDHGCEYMTGGRVVILGETGRNFAAGMSGGIAYIWDNNNSFRKNCNMGMIDLDPVDTDEDKAELKHLIENHKQYTDSEVATLILNDWDTQVKSFIKVMPVDYKRVLAELAEKSTLDNKALAV
ncbi:Glutamate synthase [NADPH] large chain [hydrothermal vent metagenome]|uniref:Glutamate synthase [NADPH] large chain n=1 Tax=hydrothermal vent metagenome TaxID=652676 RepID=A0A3B0YLR9_9ZZZZ